MPTVYIIISVYNWENYFLEQLMSIYYQNYKNWHLFIVDDWSTDSSYQIAENFIKNYDLSKKVKIIKQENQWTCKAIERWLIEVQKINKLDNLVALCDADDIWTRDKLEVQVKYMHEQKECDLCFHDLTLIDKDNNLKSTSFIKSEFRNVANPYNNSFFELAVQNHITTTEIIFRTKYISDIIPIQNEWAKDYWTALIFAIKKRNIHFINKKLWFYRKWHTSIQKQLKYAWPIKSCNRDRDMFNLLKKRFPEEKEILYFINYLSDRIRWYENGNSPWMCRLLILVNYPKIFFRMIKNIINNHINFNQFKK